MGPWCLYRREARGSVRGEDNEMMDVEPREMCSENAGRATSQGIQTGGH